MIAGVGMFATVSGLAASLFLGARDGKSDELKEVLARLKILEAKLTERQNDERSKPNGTPDGIFRGASNETKARQQDGFDLPAP